MSGEQLLQNFVTYIIDPTILLVFTAGFMFFVWGLVVFLMDLEEGKQREQGIQHMIWGIAGMFIMASVYGIISLLDNTFGLDAFNATPDMSRWKDFEVPYFTK